MNTLRLFLADSSIVDLEVVKSGSSSAYAMTSYRKTLHQISVYAGRVDGIAITTKLRRQDFNAMLLVEQIRLCENFEIARLPILLCVPPEDSEIQSKFSGKLEELYLEWGVAKVDLASNDIIESLDDFPEKLPDQAAITAYTEQIALVPRSNTGPHDMANLWGPYSILLSLSKVGSGHEPMRDLLAEQLQEDPFYVKKLNEHRKQSEGGAEVRELSNKIKDLKQRLSASKPLKVLVVEDQLSDGWEVAYRAVADALGSSLELKFAETPEVAEKYNPADLDLVILDVRLTPSRDLPENQEYLDAAANFSGVQLAARIRKRSSTVPILAATASNKVWTLESLAEHGINAYWVKESPQVSTEERHSLLSTLALIEKITAVLMWNMNVRPDVDAVFELSRQVTKYDAEVGTAFINKAELLAAHQFRGLDKYRSHTDRSLDADVSFLLIYSMINDLFSWLVVDKNGEGTIKTPHGYQLKLYTKVGSRKRELANDARLKGLSRDDVTWTDEQLPESVFMEVLLLWLGLRSEATRFDDLKGIRNKLPLVHGRLHQQRGVGYRHASAEDIGSLVTVLGSAVLALCNGKILQKT